MRAASPISIFVAALAALGMADAQVVDDLNTELDSFLDSLTAGQDSVFIWDDVVPEHWSAPADTVWYGDGTTEFSSRRSTRILRFSPTPVVDYSKVEGVALGARLGISSPATGLRLGGQIRRALAAGFWEGGGSLRVRRGDADLSFALSRRTVSYGSNQPYGNVLLALLAGLDHREYLDRREGVVSIRVRPSASLGASVGFVRREDASLPQVADGLLQLDEEVMERSLPVDHASLNGVTTTWAMGSARLSGVRLGGGEGDLNRPRPGAVLEAGAWGGALGGDREFYTISLVGRTVFNAPLGGTLLTEARVGLAGGDPPIQDMPDLGGEETLRAYAPREFVAPAALALRADYVLGVDVFRKAKIPLLKGLKLQPIVFGDAGSFWGEEPWRSPGDLTLPGSEGWRFDAGAGLQRYLGFPPLLSTIRLEAAWRFDRNRDRMRLNLRLIP